MTTNTYILENYSYNWVYMIKFDRERWKQVRKTSERHEHWAFSTRLNRPFSNIITYFLLETNITPNQISVSTIFIGFFSFLSYIQGRFVLGGLLLQISSIVDGVDGEIARAKKISSKLGMIVDSICDRLVEAFISAGIGFSVLQRYGPSYGYVVAMVGLFGLIMDPYLAELVRSRTGQPLHIGTKLIEEKLRFSPADRGMRLFIIFIASVLQYPEIGLLLVGSTSILYATIKFFVWLWVYTGGKGKTTKVKSPESA